MDTTEKLFKLSFDLLLTILITPFLWVIGQSVWVIFLAFILSHTFNFLFNGHLWGLLKHYGTVKTEKEILFKYLKSLVIRARKESSIKHLYLLGSLVRHEFSSSSDLDLRIVRNKGLVNGLRSCFFAFVERSRSLLNRIPLDMYVLDKNEEVYQSGFDGKPLDLLPRS